MGIYHKNRFIGGFTIIELVVIIVVIGILASIGVLSYTSWKRNTIVSQVKSDLNVTVAALENYRNFGNSFPQDVNTLTNLTKSSGVTLSGGSLDGGKSYCINAQTSQFADVLYYIDSDTRGAKVGSCPTTYTANLNLMIDGANTGKIVVVDGSYTQSCVKTSSQPITCDLPYLYTGSGKTLTSVTAVPDNSADLPGMKWYDYWECLINSSPQLLPSSYTNFDDVTYHVNFGAHVYDC